MNRTIAGLLALTLAAILTACAATPEQSAVTRKDQQQLIETAGRLEDPSLTIADQVNAPERYQTEFGVASEDVTFHVDAEVRLSDADAAKIIRVSQRDFTQDEVDRWTEYLFPGETLYDPSALDEPTRSELEAALIQYRKRLEELEESGAGDEIVPMEEVAAAEESPNGEEPEQSVSEESATAADEVRATIARLEQALLDAPEERTWTETDKRLRTNPNGEGSYLEFAVPDEAGTSIRCLDVYNFPGFQNVRYLNRGDTERNGSNDIDRLPDTDSADYRYWVNAPEPTLSQQEAEETAAEFLKCMGLDETMQVISADMVLSVPAAADEFGNYYGSVFKCWKIEFSRNLDGIAITKVYEQGTSPEEGEWWSYEHPIVYVDDSGVREFWYEGPYAVEDTVVEHCKLLPFDEIMEVFQSFCRAAYRQELSDSILSEQERFDIGKIQFGYTRITETNTNASGLLIPTWTFVGVQSGQRVYRDGQTYTYVFPENTLLTINAIDGSVIDLNEGY